MKKDLKALEEENMILMQILMQQERNKGLQVRKREKAQDDLLQAIESSYHDGVVLALEKNYADINYSYEKREGKTPLILASIQCDFKLVKFFVEQEARLDVRDRFGNSAIIYAIARDKSGKIAEYLSDNGAEINYNNPAELRLINELASNYDRFVTFAKMTKFDFNQKDIDGHTLLYNLVVNKPKSADPGGFAIDDKVLDFLLSKEDLVDSLLDVGTQDLANIVKASCIICARLDFFMRDNDAPELASQILQYKKLIDISTKKFVDSVSDRSGEIFSNIVRDICNNENTLEIREQAFVALENFINIDLVQELTRQEERWSATRKAWVGAAVRAGFDLGDRVASAGGGAGVAGGGTGAAADDHRTAGAGAQVRPAAPTPTVRQSSSGRGLGGV